MIMWGGVFLEWFSYFFNF